MRLINFCRHKTVGWEGVLYLNDRNEVRITNGVCEWAPTQHRMDALQFVDTINIPHFLSYLEYRPGENALVCLLRGDIPDFRKDAEYLSRPLVEGMAYEISDTRVAIQSPSTSLAGFSLPERYNQASLLESYQQVFKAAKNRGVRISYSLHIKRDLTARWGEYETAADEQEQLFKELAAQARVVQCRGVHVGYCDDEELTRLFGVKNRLLSYGWGGGVTSCITSIASSLEGYQRYLAGTPKQYDMISL